MLITLLPHKRRLRNLSTLDLQIALRLEYPELKPLELRRDEDAEEEKEEEEGKKGQEEVEEDGMEGKGSSGAMRDSTESTTSSEKKRKRKSEEDSNSTVDDSATMSAGSMIAQQGSLLKNGAWIRATLLFNRSRNWLTIYNH